MKILSNNPPGGDWRIYEAHCGIELMKNIGHGMPQLLPSFGSSLAGSCFAIMSRNNHEPGPVAQQRRPKRITTKSGAIATFCKEFRPFPKKSIVRKKRGLQSFDFGITIYCRAENQDQDRFERIRE